MSACRIHLSFTIEIPYGFTMYVKTMSAHGSHPGWRSWSPDTILKEEKTFKQFSHRSYVKTMSADGGHFGPRSGSLNIFLAVDHLRTIDDMFAILKIDHLRTIHAMFALN